MEKKEFEDFMLDRSWRNFFIFMDTENMDSGENVYHHCKNCSYETKHVETISSDTMQQIDANAVDHVWNKHRSYAEKFYKEFRAITIASAPGQKRLE